MAENKEFKLKLSNFEGTLDLLDTLIKEKKMDILKLDVSIITDQYLNFIQSQINTINIDDASQYLEMANYLVNLKSKRVLPVEGIIGDEHSFEYERDKLIQRLVNYRKYKEAVVKMQEKQKARLQKYSKTTNDFEDYEPESLTVETIPDHIDPKKLFTALYSAFEKYRATIFYQRKIKVQELSVAEIEDDLWTFLLDNQIAEITFLDYLKQLDPSIISQQFIVTTFLALLDLAKYGRINIRQAENNQDIIIKTLGV